jgi:plastocyanin
MHRVARTTLIALSIGTLLLAACSKASTTAQTTGTPSPGSDVASATATSTGTSDDGVQHLHFEYGPIDIQPGQNSIEFTGGKVPKPNVDGYIVGIRPNLVRPDGSVPGVDVVHLHHGVWLNASAKDATRPALPERLFASGEEKTYVQMPTGYGYAYKASDKWIINYMLHDLLPTPDKVSITYDIDFVPADSAAAKSIEPVRPIWLDVQNGETYPVFDAIKGSGVDGEFTYPKDAGDPYNGAQTNTWKVDRDGVLVGVGGHLHPGGLHDDLYLTRAGASAAPGSDATGSVEGDTAHVFRSEAKYFEPAGAVSWDVAMTVAPPEWRVAIKQGDTLSTQTTYDVTNASWYESMGIMNAWMADAGGASAGADPFVTKVDVEGAITHGHLAENDNHGGSDAVIAPDPLTLPSAPAVDRVDVLDFVYAPGDMANYQSVPTVAAGQAITFTNGDDKTGKGLWHTITACKAPCNKSTGIAYPLADGDITFDSGELGTGGPPTSGRVTWSTPTNLPSGTYSYFCRIHPFMRGSFRVTP